MPERTEILTSGRAGLVGSRVYELLQHKYTWGLDLDLRTSGVDITDPNQVFELMCDSRADVIIHFAAFTDTGAASKEEGNLMGNCYRVNVLGTKNIAEACERFGKHLIHVSTDFVLDGENPDYQTEQSPRKPTEWYGETKRRAEEIVEGTLPSYTMARIGFPFTANPSRPDNIARIQNGLRNGTLPPQFSDHFITPTFIDDIAVALNVLIAERPQGILHITGSTSLSPFELSKKVAVLSGFEPSVVQEGSLTDYLKTGGRKYPRYLRVSNQRVVRDLQIPMRDIDESLSQVILQQNSR